MCLNNWNNFLLIFVAVDVARLSELDAHYILACLLLYLFEISIAIAWPKSIAKLCVDAHLFPLVVLEAGGQVQPPGLSWRRLCLFTLSLFVAAPPISSLSPGSLGVSVLHLLHHLLSHCCLCTLCNCTR